MHIYIPNLILFNQYHFYAFKVKSHENSPHSCLQVEEMKGKIRVFCRVRPVSADEARRGGMDAEQVVAADDPFTVSVTAQRGHKAFLFDRVFQPNHDQEEVFADTNVSLGEEKKEDDKGERGIRGFILGWRRKSHLRKEKNWV